MRRPASAAILLAMAVSTAMATDGDRPKAPVSVDPSRFGQRAPDEAYGAFQRGLYLTALNLALPRAEKGDAAAQTLVAEIYARGLGVPLNPAASAKWYGEAAKSGVPEAQFRYALILLDGKQVARDAGAAERLMKSAADAGNPLAQFNYAQMLVDRDDSPKGMADALAYYRKAAETGLADAAYAVGQIRLTGADGRQPDIAEARRWFTQAAEKNFDAAQVELATLLVQARNGTDEKAGFAWMKRAAEGGNVAAQNRLAKLYHRAIGTDANLVEAGAWYILARRAGLKDPEMDDFFDGLTEEESKKALERANRLR